MGARVLRVKRPQQGGEPLPSARDVLARWACHGGPRVPGVGQKWGVACMGSPWSGPEWGPPIPLRGWFLYLPPSLLPSPAAPELCPCRAEPFRAP